MCPMSWETSWSRATSTTCSSNLQPTDAKALPVANGGCLADQTGLGIQIDKGFVASFDNVLVTSP